MRVTGIEVGEREKKAIESIYRYLKEAFPLAEYDDRGEILGIGEPGRRLLCYFSVDAGGLRIKFKDSKAVHLSENIDWVPMADSAVRLFRENGFALKQEGYAPKRERKKVPVKETKIPENRTPSDKNKLQGGLEDYLYGLGEEMAEIPESARGCKFGGCSVRLFHCLQDLGVVTVGDLFRYTPAEICRTKNFGKQCLAELYRILRAVNGKAPALTARSAPPMIDYETSYEDYKANEDRYKELYAALSDLFFRLAGTKLDERMRTVVYARLGLGGSAKTLRGIGADLGISQERVRQIFVKSMRRLMNSPPLDMMKELREFQSAAEAYPVGGLLVCCYLESGELFTEFVCKRFFRQELQKDALRDAVRKGGLKEGSAAGQKVFR